MNHQEMLERFKNLNHDPPTLYELGGRVWLWVIILLMMSFALLFSKDEVRITVSPRTFICIPQRNLQVIVRVRIEPHPDNRLLTLVWASDYGTSGKGFYELDGEKSFRTLTRFVEINCTTYLFEACLHRIVNGKPVRFCDKQFLEPGGTE